MGTNRVRNASSPRLSQYVAIRARQLSVPRIAHVRLRAGTDWRALLLTTARRQA